MEINMRSLDINDLEEADQLLQNAFGTPEKRKVDLQRYLSLQPDGWFGAVLEDQLVGMVGAVNYGEFAYIGLMGVHPDFQRRSIGNKLMQNLLDWLNMQNCPIALLDSTDAGKTMYDHLGFIDAGQTCQYGYDGSGNISLNKWVSPMELSEIQQIVEYDTPIFGANRERVFQIYFHDLRNRAFVTHDENNQITGFIFAQTNRIGPWMASSVEDAESLLTMALNLEFETDPIILTPNENPDVHELLTRAGFSLKRSITHMRYGGDNHPQRRDAIWGLTSFAIG
jgi:GNAT superfamily N-acetyltransferase